MHRARLNRARAAGQVCGVHQALLFELCFLHQRAISAAHTGLSVLFMHVASWLPSRCNVRCRLQITARVAGLGCRFGSVPQPRERFHIVSNGLAAAYREAWELCSVCSS